MGKQLTSQAVQQMKTMVVNGVAPEDIARQFGIAISSVHNYKKKFKEQGVKFPSVKGKRPTGSVDIPGASPKTSDDRSTRSKNNSSEKGDMQFIINGTKVNIQGQASNVTIGKNSIEIEF